MRRLREWRNGGGGGFGGGGRRDGNVRARMCCSLCERAHRVCGEPLFSEISDVTYCRLQIRCEKNWIVYTRNEPKTRSYFLFLIFTEDINSQFSINLNTKND